MNKKIIIISILVTIFILLFQLNVFAGYSLTIETKSDVNACIVGKTVNITVDWEQKMQTAGLTLRYNSTKLSFEEASISNEYYSISEPIVDETSGDSFTDIVVEYTASSEINESSIRFTFKTLALGDADISVTEADGFANENEESPEQIDFTIKGSKTIKITTLGDIDLDGKITSTDAAILLSYLSGRNEEIYQLNNDQLKVADVCADGEVDELDGEILEKYVNHWTISFPFIYGDVDCNGEVTINDASLLQQYNYPNSNKELSREGLIRADVNLDGQVNEFDRIIIQRCLAEMTGYTKLPITVKKNNSDGSVSELKKININEDTMISGFETSDLNVSNFVQQINSDLNTDIYNARGEKIEIDNKLMGTGYKIKVDEKTKEEVPNQLLAGVAGEYTVIIYGDTTGDGKINAIDALALIKDINNKIPFTSEIYRQAGRIVTPNNQNPTAVDALAIIKAANGKYEINQSK